MKKKNQWTIRDIENNKISYFKVGNEVSEKPYPRFTNFIKGGLTVFISVLIIFTAVQAGSLTPSASPAATGYTLGDIYTRLTTNASATEGNHDFAPGASPAGTLYTLTQIYAAIPIIAANTVKLGTSYLGVDGTLVPSGGDAGTSNVCNGNTFFGSSQADWNLQTGALTISPSAVISGNTYCGVAGTAVATPTYGDNDASKVLTTAGNAGTYDAANLSVENVRNAIAFGVGQAGTFTGNLAYGDDNAANVLTIAATPGTYNISNLSNSVIKQDTTWGVSLVSTGTLTPDGGTATTADLFNGKTAHLTADWNLDAGALDLACNTASFNGAGNIVSDAYDGDGLGDNRWCMTDSGDAATSDILSGKFAWVDGVERTGAYDASSLATGTVKSGTSFGVGLTGEYPSAVNTLPNADVTTDDLASSAGNITSSNGAIEWWQSDGTRQIATLDFPALSSVCINATSNNTAGALNPSAISIGAGNTICGVGGTLLQNEYNGSAGSSVLDPTFYALNNFDSLMPNNTVKGFFGGVDDYNGGQISGDLGVMPVGSYAGAGWSNCTVDNDYCEVGDTAVSADKKDNSTGLVWSIRIGADTWFWANNCYEPLTPTYNPVKCDTTGDDGCQCVKKPSGSKVGCEALDSIGGNTLGPWRTPTQKELMQAYIDGSWGNLSLAGYSYWSATTRSNNTHRAWYTYLNHGYTNYTTKTSTTISVRCVR